MSRRAYSESNESLWWKDQSKLKSALKSVATIKRTTTCASQPLTCNNQLKQSYTFRVCITLYGWVVDFGTGAAHGRGRLRWSRNRPPNPNYNHYHSYSCILRMFRDEKEGKIIMISYRILPLLLYCTKTLKEISDFLRGVNFCDFGRTWLMTTSKTWFIVLTIVSYLQFSQYSHDDTQ